MALHQAEGAQRGVGTRALSTAAVGAICLLAWGALLLWQRSPAGAGAGHHGLGAARGDGAQALAFVAGWVVMVLAMMLPPTLPFLLAFQRRGGRGAGLARLSALLLAGYVLSWALFGVALYAGAWLLHQLLRPDTALGALAALPPLVAGAYQLTPLKRGALEACRAAPGCATAGAAGGARQALLAGLHHGRCCVGCCWALMALMATTGAHSLAWMAGLGVVMAAEKGLPRGRQLGALVGVALLGWGLLLLLGGAAPGAHPHQH